LSFKAVDPLRYRVRFLVLLLLAIRPSHGYELLKRLDEVTLGLIRGGPGTIYPVLKELKDEGLITEKEISYYGRPRKVYEITKKGAIELIRSIDIFHSIVHNIIELTVEARKKLVEKLGKEEPLLYCPDERLISILRKFNELIAIQIKKLERELERCKSTRTF
jgi:DNA-binding PadR family transcriptional regulator